MSVTGLSRRFGLVVHEEPRCTSVGAPRGVGVSLKEIAKGGGGMGPLRKLTAPQARLYF